MKKICLCVAAIFWTLAGIAQKEIKPADARNNVGETVKLCTRITSAYYEEKVKGSPTTLYTQADTSNAPITFMIWGDKRKNFDYKPEKDLKDREVCITGKIMLLEEKTVLVIDRQSQIEIK